MNIKVRLALVLCLILALLAPIGISAQSGEGDPALLKKMHEINKKLAQRGLNIAVEEIDFYSIGGGRDGARIHQQTFRWAAGDERRLAQGDDITYLFDRTYGRTSSGLSASQTEAAIDRAMATWDANACLDKVDLVKRADPGGDLTIFDYFYGGRYGDPFEADIVNAGWWPRDFFEAVGGPGGGRGILAFSVTFIFTEDDGTPTDINGDNYLDTALNEVYYNDTFGQRRTDREGNPWGINIALPGIDVETVALHENGHSLGLGHFGPPPQAVMNPVYWGINQTPLSADESGMCAVWSSWPQ